METEAIISRRQAVKGILAATLASVAAVREFPRVLAQTEGTPVAEEEPLPEVKIVTKEIFDKEQVELSFEPKDIKLNVDEKVAISFSNEGVLPHDWSVLPLANHGDEDGHDGHDDDMDHEHMMDEHHGHDDTQPPFIVFDEHEGESEGDSNHEHHHKEGEFLLHVYADPGETKKIVVMPTTTGEYDCICTVPGHKELGMTGKLIVDGNTAEHDQDKDHDH